MPEEDTFAVFLQRLRSGDEQAAVELVRRYEPSIRREIRMRLSSPGLYRLVDSVDICQSVLASFFVRAAAGQYDLEQPGQLLGLLLGMARNKLAFQARKQRAQRRDVRRVVSAGVEDIDPAGSAASPSRVVASKELLHLAQQRLSAEERQLADLRGQGLSWAEIAAQLGGTADGRRMQLTRALDRIGQELGLDDNSED